MAREKKITVKPFLNKYINPKVLKLRTPGYYPLYFQVIYNRKTTRFSGGDKWYRLSEEQEVIKSEIVQTSINQIQEVVRYMANRYDDFEIKGIGTGVRSFASSVGTAIYMAISEEVDNLLYKSLSREKYDTWKFSGPDYIRNGVKMLGKKLDKDTRFLADNSDVFENYLEIDISVYDWMFGSGKSDYMTNLKKSDHVKINELIGFIDKALEISLDRGANAPIFSKTGTYDGIAELFRIKFPD